MKIEKKAKLFVNKFSQRVQIEENQLKEKQICSLFRSAIHRLPECPLRTELLKKFDGYMDQLLRCLKLAVADKDMPLSSEDVSLKSTVLMEVDSSQQWLLPYNMFAKKKKMDKKVLMQFAGDKSHIYSVYLNEIWADLPSLDSIQVMLKSCKPSDEIGRCWLDDIKKLCTVFAGHPEPACLQQVMQIFHVNLSSEELKTCNIRRLNMLKIGIGNFLTFCHVQEQSSKEFTHPSYGDLVAAILSVYIDVCLLLSVNLSDSERHVMAKHLCTVVLYLLHSQQDVCLDVLIQCDYLEPGNCQLVMPLLRRVLEKPSYCLSAAVYTKYMIAGHLAHRLLSSDITDTITGLCEIKRPKHYLKWIQLKCPDLTALFKQHSKNISHFLIVEADDSVIVALTDILTTGMEQYEVMETSTDQQCHQESNIETYFFIDQDVCLENDIQVNSDGQLVTLLDDVPHSAESWLDESVAGVNHSNVCEPFKKTKQHEKQKIGLERDTMADCEHEYPEDIHMEIDADGGDDDEKMGKDIEDLSRNKFSRNDLFVVDRSGDKNVAGEMSDLTQTDDIQVMPKKARKKKHKTGNDTQQEINISENYSAEDSRLDGDVKLGSAVHVEDNSLRKIKKSKIKKCLNKSADGDDLHCVANVSDNLLTQVESCSKNADEKVDESKLQSEIPTEPLRATDREYFELSSDLRPDDKDSLTDGTCSVKYPDDDGQMNESHGHMSHDSNRSFDLFASLQKNDDDINDIVNDVEVDIVAGTSQTEAVKLMNASVVDVVVEETCDGIETHLQSDVIASTSLASCPKITSGTPRKLNNSQPEKLQSPKQIRAGEHNVGIVEDSYDGIDTQSQAPKTSHFTLTENSPQKLNSPLSRKLQSPRQTRSPRNLKLPASSVEDEIETHLQVRPSQMECGKLRSLQSEKLQSPRQTGSPRNLKLPASSPVAVTEESSDEIDTTGFWNLTSAGGSLKGDCHMVTIASPLKLGSTSTKTLQSSATQSPLRTHCQSPVKSRSQSSNKLHMLDETGADKTVCAAGSCDTNEVQLKMSASPIQASVHSEAQVPNVSPKQTGKSRKLSIRKTSFSSRFVASDSAAVGKENNEMEVTEAAADSSASVNKANKSPSNNNASSVENTSSVASSPPYTSIISRSAAAKLLSPGNVSLIPVSGQQIAGQQQVGVGGSDKNASPIKSVKVKPSPISSPNTAESTVETESLTSDPPSPQIPVTGSIHSDQEGLIITRSIRKAENPAYERALKSYFLRKRSVKQGSLAVPNLSRFLHKPCNYNDSSMKEFAGSHSCVNESPRRKQAVDHRRRTQSLSVDSPSHNPVSYSNKSGSNSTEAVDVLTNSSRTVKGRRKSESFISKYISSVSIRNEGNPYCDTTSDFAPSLRVAAPRKDISPAMSASEELMCPYTIISTPLKTTQLQDDGSDENAESIKHRLRSALTTSSQKESATESSVPNTENLTDSVQLSKEMGNCSPCQKTAESRCKKTKSQIAKMSVENAPSDETQQQWSSRLRKRMNTSSCHSCDATESDTKKSPLRILLPFRNSPSSQKRRRCDFSDT